MNKRTQFLLQVTAILWTMMVVVARLITAQPLSKVLIDVTFAAMVGWMAGLLVEKFIGWARRIRKFGFPNYLFSHIHRWQYRKIEKYLKSKKRPKEVD